MTTTTTFRLLPLFLAAEGPGPAAAAAPAAAVGVAGRVAEARARPAAAAAAGAGAPLEPRLAAPLAPLLARLLALVLALLAAGDLVAPLLAELLARLLAGVLRLRRLGLVVRHADDGRREALLLEPLRDAHRVHGADHRQRALVGVDLHRLDPWSKAQRHGVVGLFCHKRHYAWRDGLFRLISAYSLSHNTIELIEIRSAKHRDRWRDGQRN